MGAPALFSLFGTVEVGAEEARRGRRRARRSEGESIVVGLEVWCVVF